MCTFIFCRSYLSSSILVPHSSGFLVASSSLNLANFLLSRVSIKSFIHVCITSPYVLDSTFDSSTIWNHTISSCASIRSFQAVKLSRIRSKNYFYYILSASSTNMFLSYVSMTWYPLIPDLAMDFRDHTGYFSFSPTKGIF